MKKFLVAAAVLMLGFPALVQAQRWGNQRPAGYAPYGFGVFTNSQPANLRLDVSPNDAQVYVDALYLGRVDAFNSAFERLRLSGGPHLIEIRKPGFTSLAMTIAVFPGQDLTFSRKLQPAASADRANVETIPAASGVEFAPPCNGPSGALRLDVAPKDAEVYADGYFVGRASDFSGSQRMMLTQDRHHLVLKREGFETVELNLTVDGDRSATYRAVMKKN